MRTLGTLWLTPGCSHAPTGQTTLGFRTLKQNSFQIMADQVLTRTEWSGWVSSEDGCKPGGKQDRVDLTGDPHVGHI